MSEAEVREYLLSAIEQKHVQYVERYITTYNNEAGTDYWLLHEPNQDLHQEFLMFLGELEADDIITLD